MKYCFAPMEGITTHIFRAVHSRRFPGADRYYTPFFSPTSDHLFTPREPVSYTHLTLPTILRV